MFCIALLFVPHVVTVWCRNRWVLQKFLHCSTLLYKWLYREAKTSQNYLHMLLKVFQVHMQNFVATGSKLHSDEKNNDGSDTNSCAQGQVTLFLMLENVTSCEIHMRMCVVYGTQNISTHYTPHTFSCEFHYPKHFLELKTE